MTDGDVADLIRLGRIGYVRGIEARLRDMEDGPLKGELEGYVERFDLKGLVRRLEVHRDGG